MTEETGSRRSDSTRAAILDAARRHFAREGFAKATIRAIAGDAGIDPSMVMRYYGSKEGLFDAALDVDLGLPDLGAVAEDALGEAVALRFLELWETSPGNELLLALLRSSVSDDTVAQRFQQVFAGQLMPMVMRIGDPADAPRRAGLVVSQILGLALCRYVLRLEPVVALSREQIVTTVGATVQRYLVSTPD
ncbi:TetR/AcrR family transcriptional regulator [Nocardia vermiculata]|uniref:TetR/AcrR family transcriptional regulator n=1 Tax=Nocardia vermiculata TaxID=257274 RepID=A0A846Y020_9NOCA|nr:TetR family transcriptional regulator [Nocardia vermiculata]NKY50638.1 TetR/AcrR family transcriptional regulator [Nocardia vermiculata]